MSQITQVEKRPNHFKVDQSLVNSLKLQKAKYLPGSKYDWKLDRFPRNLAASVVEHEEPEKKIAMASICDKHDARRLRDVHRLQEVVKYEKDRQELKTTQRIFRLKSEIKSLSDKKKFRSRRQRNYKETLHSELQKKEANVQKALKKLDSI